MGRTEGQLEVKEGQQAVRLVVKVVPKEGQLEVKEGQQAVRLEAKVVPMGGLLEALTANSKEV